MQTTVHVYIKNTYNLVRDIINPNNLYIIMSPTHIIYMKHKIIIKISKLKFYQYTNNLFRNNPTKTQLECNEVS